MRLLAAQCARDPDLLPMDPDVEGLEPRDAALAHTICDTAIRRWETLDWLLQQRLKRPIRDLDTRVHAALLAGAAQVVFLDRVPVHAAIDASVEWAKRRVGKGASGLVNAVLRRTAEAVATLPKRPPGEDARGASHDAITLEDGSTLDASSLGLPDGRLEKMAVLTATPRRLLLRWDGAGESAALRRALHALVRPPTVLNIGHSALLNAAEDPNLSPHDDPRHAVWNGPRAELGDFLARHGVWAQDASAGDPVRMIADLAPRRIIDACAGMGTKTRQLRATFPNASIIATDIDAKRLRALGSVFEHDEMVEVVPHASLRERYLESADLVLIDAPCSNSGVLARRVEAKRRIGKALIERLADIQRQIIADTIPLLASGGAILYATCSLEPEENEQIAGWARKWHKFSIAREHRAEPAGLPGGGAASYRDGSYAALLTR